jgi:hypothetical protein
MKNVTVSLDDETYRRGRIWAAARDTSLSALVRQFLVSLGAAETEYERLKGEEERIRSEIHTFQASDRITRDALHERGAS